MVIIDIICPRCKQKMKFLPKKIESIITSYKSCVFCGTRIRVKYSYIYQ